MDKAMITVSKGGIDDNIGTDKDSGCHQVNKTKIGQGCKRGCKSIE
jgi:hypothetical protein